MKETSNLSASDKKLRGALIKKALGYDATEVVEEYISGEEGEIKLSKKKVTKKNVPPDLSAIKMLLDESQSNISDMSDEDLENEKVRLMAILAEKLNAKGAQN